MGRLMYNCREVTQMISESLDRRLPFHQRVGIRVHLFICKFCSRYRKQLLFLREIIRMRVMRVEDKEPSILLAPGARERMKRSILDALNGSE